TKRFGGNPARHRVACNVGICDFDTALAGFENRSGASQQESLPPHAFRGILQRDPAGPYHWRNLGESLHKAGRTAEARYCFARSLALGPHIPTMLIKAAQFHWDFGESAAALEMMTRALQGDPGRAGEVFSEYETRNIPVDVALRNGLPADAGIWRAF